MTAALVPLTGVAKLAAVAVTYVRDTPAPEPCYLALNPGSQTVEIQPDVRRVDPVGVLGTLLVWTHRLTGITGDWWHTSSGELHITLTGRSPSGVRFLVYSSFPYRAARRHVALTAGARESVTPDELYRLALELRKGQNK
ncbi:MULTISPECIES: hypothetical protein [unclassified Amycolatopsis]|uniref:hypothetical protein n=1 Tax=unclassified Amycolatopsis TaxID=2618356 RepID=UPI0028761351|nr:MULTISPECIES: hypothetical protein [unclassified Amycolatopsis]MDS0137570.1 hypothetical protein [Amycolatopsis sp. 505]MDS0141765.1 hypothetical protein [Amycolatopsis sp. CM201R]